MSKGTSCIKVSSQHDVQSLILKSFDHVFESSRLKCQLGYKFEWVQLLNWCCKTSSIAKTMRENRDNCFISYSTHSVSFFSYSSKRENPSVGNINVKDNIISVFLLSISQSQNHRQAFKIVQIYQQQKNQQTECQKRRNESTFLTLCIYLFNHCLVR